MILTYFLPSLSYCYCMVVASLCELFRQILFFFWGGISKNSPQRCLDATGKGKPYIAVGAQHVDFPIDIGSDGQKITRKLPTNSLAIFS